MSVDTDTALAVDAGWQTVATIHRRVGQWSRFSVRTSLVALAAAGAVEKRSLPYGPFMRNEYRRVAA